MKPNAARPHVDTMLEQCATLLGSGKLDSFESGFLVHAIALAEVRGTEAFTQNQVECLTHIHTKSFPKTKRVARAAQTQR